jgi:hypothetical protein
MKPFTGFALFTLVTGLGMCKASAQDHAIQANVPFAFAVSDRTLPSGSYTITKVNADTIEIQNRTMHLSALSRAFADSRDLGAGGKLVFNKYGGQYFLKEILCSRAGMSVNLPASKLEEKAEKEEASMKAADEVLVAVK